MAVGKYSSVMRMKIRIMMIAGALALFGSGAQAAPWCAHFNTGLNDCNFYSFQQCRAAVSGVGGVCAQNTFERPYWPPSDRRRRYRRDY
jgi:hypothetical protein